MNTSLERLDDCKAKITAEVPASAAKSNREQIVSAFAMQAKVPGFRPGKIPQSVIEKRYAKQIEEELKERLVRDALNDSAKKEDITIMGIVKIERELFEADGAFSLIAEVVLEPDVKIENYKEIPVDVPKAEITDEMVDESLKEIQKNLAEMVEVERAAATNDIVAFNYVAKIDDETKENFVEKQLSFFTEYEGVEVELLEEEENLREPLPGIAAAVTGMKKDEEKGVDIVFPEDFGAEDLAGKTITYAVTVAAVKERDLPEINDELATKLGTEDLADLKTRVRQQNEQELEKSKTQIIQSQILEHLDKKLEFDIPQHVLFNETQHQVNQMVQQGYQQGLQEEDIQENQDQLLSNAEQRAKANVKTNFILRQIAEAENLSVGDEELTQRLMMDASQQGVPVKKYFRQLQKDNQIEGIRNNILLSKTLEFLTSNATITEVDPPEENEAKA